MSARRRAVGPQRRYVILGIAMLCTYAGAQTICTTENLHADAELWTDPAYYLNNTVDEIRGMALATYVDDALVMQTNQIRGWHGCCIDFTDALETVERYRRVGERLEG